MVEASTSGDMEFNQLSAHDLIQKHLIEYVFNACSKATMKEESIAGFTHLTGFVRSVRIMYSLLWKYAPVEVKAKIKQLYAELEAELKRIEDSSLSEPNKDMAKRKAEDETAFNVLQLCLIVLQYSPANVEFREMTLFSDYREIAEEVQNPEPIKLFSEDIKTKEEKK